MRLIPLASSSHGNSTAIVAGGIVVIIDAGISRRETIRRLAEEGVLNHEKTSPDFLLITHEHGDHAGYVKDWLKHTQPIVATAGTATKLGIEGNRAWIQARPFHPLVLAPGVVATSISIQHNAAEPVAWRVSCGGEAAIVATDLGTFPPGWDAFCKGAGNILLEANHHPDLLETCSYPELTKRRIHETHLSVVTTADWVRDRLPAETKRLWIGHVSRKSCDPKIVRHLIGEAAAGKGIEVEVLEK